MVILVIFFFSYSFPIIFMQSILEMELQNKKKCRRFQHWKWIFLLDPVSRQKPLVHFTFKVPHLLMMCTLKKRKWGRVLWKDTHLLSIQLHLPCVKSIMRKKRTWNYWTPKYPTLSYTYSVNYCRLTPLVFNNFSVAHLYSLTLVITLQGCIFVNPLQQSGKWVPFFPYVNNLPGCGCVVSENKYPGSNWNATLVESEKHIKYGNVKRFKR